jgi:serine protease Do
MKTLTRLVLMAMVAAGGLARPAAAVDGMLRDFEAAFIRIGDEMRPCVVNIEVKGRTPEEIGDRGMEFYEDLFKFFNIPIPSPEERPRPNTRWRWPRPVVGGSGFIYDKQGHIITNNHVLEDAGTIKVRLWDGKEYDAKIVGKDPDTDVAVIKIEADRDLPAARLGDSDKIQVGQFAIALGNPGGLEGTVSFGHISALGREHLRLPEELRFQNFIQTDAAINLGNSGGPLCNIDGEVIGINTAIVLGGQSLGFAIPINTAKRILPELIARGKVTRGFLGVMVRDVGDLAEALDLPDGKGAYVEQAMPGSPADKAGIKVYDVIRKVNGEPVEGSSQLVSKISVMAPGATATLEIWRNRAAKVVEVKLDEYEGDVEKEVEGKKVLGIEVESLTPEIAGRLGLEPRAQGVLVTEVEPDSASEDAGLIEGDIILDLDQKPVRNAEEFYRLLEEHAVPGKSFLVRMVRPGGEPNTRVIKVPAETKGN